MTRKRMIDPSIWADEDFGALSANAKILFIGLFSNADDKGRIRANSAYLKSTIFMYDDINNSTVKEYLDEVCQKMKSVRYYVADGKEIIQLLHWNEYQKQHKDRIQESTLPPYDNDVSDNVGQVTDNVGVSKLSKLSKDKLIIDTNVSSDKVAEKEIVSNKNPINNLIGLFKEVNPNFERLYANTSQRSALNRMISKYGQEKIQRVISSLPRTNTMQYFPVITTPVQLENKLGQLIALLNKEKSKQGKVAIQT